MKLSNNTILGMFFLLFPFLSGAKCEIPKINVSEYHPIDCLSEGLAAAGKGDKWGYIDAQGKVVLPFKYRGASQFSCGAGRVLTKNQGWKIIDKKGNILPTTEQYKKVWCSDSDEYRLRRYTLDGWIVDENEWRLIWGFNDNIAIFREPNLVKHRGWILVNKANGETKRLLFDRVGKMRNERAAVSQEGKRGFINTQGDIAIPLIYDSVSDFKQGVARVTQAGKSGFIDTNGKAIIPMTYEDGFVTHSKNLLAVKQQGKWGLISTTGKVISPADFDNIWDFYDGLAQVEQQGKRGFIDTMGKVSIPIEFDEAVSFENGQAKVRKKGTWGIIDKKGEIIVPIQYDAITPIDKNRAKVIQNNQLGLINFKTGQKILPTDHDDIGFFNDVFRHIPRHKEKTTWLVLKKGEYFGIFDIKNNKLLLPIKFTKIDSPYNSLRDTDVLIVKNEEESISIDFFSGKIIPSKNK